MEGKTSYVQILRSSSIMGGAAGINMLISMIRTKFAAVLIGSNGIGLLASFTVIQELIGTIANLGIQSSAVREVAAAVGKNDAQAIGRTVLTLRRVCWLTGLTGMFAMMAFSPMISQLTFGSDEYTYDIAALGIIILLTNISGGQMALIQGMRRIGDMARISILGAALGALAAIGFYAWLELRGIVPSLITIAAITLLISWHFARQVPVPEVALSWVQTFTEARGMIRLGVVLMWSGLMTSTVSYLTITLITQQVSLGAVGLYSAAFALSGIFVNFVLQAMGADYYPRLTGLSGNNKAVNRLVNEQTEIGLLLATPGLLATMAMAPWIIQALYTSEFLPATDLLKWFILGCLGRVISWPLGFVMLALGKGRWFFVTETTTNLLHALLIVGGLQFFGLKGVALAFFLIYFIYTLIVLAVAHALTGFYWSRENCRLIAISFSMLVFMLLLANVLPLWPTTILGTFITGVLLISNVRSLVKRAGTKHRFVQAAYRIPMFKKICAL